MQTTNTAPGTRSNPQIPNPSIDLPARKLVRRFTKSMFYNTPIIAATGLSIFESPVCQWLGAGSSLLGFAVKRVTDYRENQEQRAILKEKESVFRRLRQDKQNGSQIILQDSVWYDNYGVDIDIYKNKGVYIVGAITGLLQLAVTGLNIWRASAIDSRKCLQTPDKQIIDNPNGAVELLNWSALIVIILAYIADKLDQYFVRDNLARHIQQVEDGIGRLNQLPDANAPSSNQQTISNTP